MPLDKNISREEFDKRLETATLRRNQNAEAMETRNARITQYITEIENAILGNTPPPEHPPHPKGGRHRRCL